MSQSTAIPVTEEFWQELSKFLNDNAITTADVARAGLSYGTARKVVSGEQKAKICKESHMIVFRKILRDPVKYRQGRPTHAVGSLQDLMDMSIGDE